MLTLLILLIFNLIVKGKSGIGIERKSWKWPDENYVKLIERNSSPFFHLLKHKLKIQVVEKIPTTPSTLDDCICVPYYQCNSNNTIISDGMGIIDVRIRQCTGDLEVCCKVLNVMEQPPSSMASIITPIVQPTSSPTSSSTSSTTHIPTWPSTELPQTSVSTTPIMTTTTTTPPPISTSSTTLPATSPSSSMYNCVCVNRTLCNSNGFLMTAGEGIINPRKSQPSCQLENQICCQLQSNLINFPIARPLTTSPAMPQSSCVCVKSYQCSKNGFVITSGAGILNPRFPNYRQGQTTCATDEICCHLSSPILSIAFPTGTGATDEIGIALRANITSKSIKNPGTSMACMCIKSWMCSPSNIVVLDPLGIIDSRFSYCTMTDEVCCRIQTIPNVVQSVLPGSNVVVIQNGFVSASSGVISTICGIPGPKCLPGECPTALGETYFAEFPWMVAIVARQNSGVANLFLCGGSMINNRAVLTAAHCVLNREKGLLVARFGQWNMSNNEESLPYQQSEVQSIVTHPNYYKDGLYHDVAVLILSTPVQLASNVQPICLPQQGLRFAPGTRCLASGWGRSGFDGQYQVQLKKIDLPLIEMNECQKRLRTTRLGAYFQLHKSFLCAGGEMDKDTCIGDGGGPLVCLTPSGQYVQIGIVSWGIGCGETNIPAVYADVSQHRQWIDQQLANYGVS